MRESTEQRANFHLGENDDDLSNESPPRTSPTLKQTGEGESLKRVTKINWFSSLIKIRVFSLKGFKSIKIN